MKKKQNREYNQWLKKRHHYWKQISSSSFPHNSKPLVSMTHLFSARKHNQRMRSTISFLIADDLPASQIVLYPPPSSVPPPPTQSWIVLEQRKLIAHCDSHLTFQLSCQILEYYTDTYTIHTRLECISHTINKAETTAATTTTTNKKKKTHPVLKYKFIFECIECFSGAAADICAFPVVKYKHSTDRSEVVYDNICFCW